MHIFSQHVPPRPNRYISPDNQEISAIPFKCHHPGNFGIRQAREKSERSLFKQGRKLYFFHGQAFGNPKNTAKPGLRPVQHHSLLPGRSQSDFDEILEADAAPA